MAYRARKKCWKIFEKGVTMTVRPSIGGEKAHSARFSIVARVILPHSHPCCRHFFFFSSPVFSNHHHHRKLSWSAKHFFPWIWMRADAWNEARGSSVESFLMTERNDSSNLMEEGRTTTLPSTFHAQLF